MSFSPEQTPLIRSKSIIVALALALGGVALIVTGNGVNFRYWKIDFGGTITSIGALVLIIGVLQWLFDRYIRANFFSEVRAEIIGSSRVADSGMCDFFADSRDVNFNEFFLASSEVVIGVNYSPKLIDNCISLLKRRTESGRRTTIVTLQEGSYAEEFLSKDYETPDISSGLRKVKAFASQLDPEQKYIQLTHVKTMLRYSFVKFDSRIWVVVGTNGLGRRSVPGFFVSSGSPWFAHFAEDIKLLMERV